MVPYLLKLLEGIGLENLDSPAATKAQIVKALKAMTRSLQHGEQVSLHRGNFAYYKAFSKPGVLAIGDLCTSAQVPPTGVVLDRNWSRSQDQGWTSIAAS